ncbi:AraC-type DNA-binding protein [Paenibacillus sp. UNCCL117]|uniref:AraC family transcriptional regulator n=1 Tax=unclassified Paenibacillus TaxID=185978 RepID=UPI000884C1EB|nr:MULTISPECIES: AraC family transcriptional regulator [unclassified Paenibacillus]SDE19065.1 AraC-type DNA-binding protein [Paenibacillus sp. cl123]SFW62086.1 AraC-type DNA-binding protein [Paenibacillus sp. UNCCL117]
MHYAMSRLSVLDVRWAGLFDVASSPTFHKRHYNPYYELIVVAEGTVHLLVEDSRLTLSVGDSILLKPWEQHGGWGDAGASGAFFWVQFSCEPGLEEFALHRAPELTIVQAERTELRTVDVRHEEPVIVPRRDRVRNRYELLAHFQELVETMREPAGYFRFKASLLLARMLHLIADDFLRRSRLDLSLPASYLTFRRLVDLLNNGYETKLTRERLEQALDRKYDYLCQVFKKYAGVSIHQYTQQLRIQRAKHLLRHTSWSVKEIAQDTGYDDPFYFSRIFKRLEGVSPQQYRDK